jgi:formate hydrogenlyase subunit 6/NADH:ubiquinone oxidoreductase subunit I
MKLGVMWRDVSTSLFRRPVTERYPFERRPAPPRLRGLLACSLEHCTGCGMCAQDCPANALEVIVLDKRAKRFVINYYADRCTFCAQCMQSCRHGCLTLQNDQWELAALTKEPFLVHYGDEADVREALAGHAA